jgi:hypothetical protein
VLYLGPLGSYLKTRLERLSRVELNLAKIYNLVNRGNVVIWFFSLKMTKIPNKLKHLSLAILSSIRLIDNLLGKA